MEIRLGPGKGDEGGSEDLPQWLLRMEDAGRRPCSGRL